MHEHVVVFNRIFFVFIFHYNENFMHPHEIARTVNFCQNSRKNAVFCPGAGLLVMRVLVTFHLLFTYFFSELVSQIPKKILFA